MSDEVQKPDLAEIKPEDVELIQKAEAQESNAVRHPAEGAAAMFGMYFPIYKNLLARMSNKQLRRLNAALVEVPLGGAQYKMLDKVEKEVYLIGDKLLQAKWSMILYTLMEHEAEKSKAQAAVQEASEQMNISDITKGENNG